MNEFVLSTVGKAKWEHFPHDADVGVRGFRATPAEAFEGLVRAMDDRLPARPRSG